MSSFPTVNTSGSFSRPANTTAYASGDLVANSTAAGSVSAIAIACGAGGIMVRRLKLAKSGTSTTNALFRVHLFRGVQTVANGDNGAFSCSGMSDYLGAYDVTIDQAFTDGAAGFGVPTIASEQCIKLSGTDVYALVEARGAYTPGSGETFTVTLDVLQD